MIAKVSANGFVEGKSILDNFFWTHFSVLLTSWGGHAAKLLEKIKKRDRQILKHWKPHEGPADWNFIVLDAPQQPIKGEKDERPEPSKE